MSEAPLMLGVSGLRGIVGESLTPEVAVRYAAAFGAWLRERPDRSNGPAHVVVGRDGRAGSEWVYQAAITGLISSGCSVSDLGVVMTPTVGIAANEHDGGLVITASHNPAEWNGLKCLISETVDLDQEDEWFSITRAPTAFEATQIIDRFKRGNDLAPAKVFNLPENKRDWIQTDATASAEHINIVLHLFRSSLRGDQLKKIKDRALFRSVVDCVNASGSRTSLPFLSSIGQVVPLNADNSGIFPHTPEPTAENLSGEGGLCDAVPGLKADVGFAQDPDGDRLAIVDENGRYIGEEYTLVLAAMSILEARKSRGREHAEGAEEDGALTPALSRGAREREAEKTPHPGPLPQGEREEDVVICVNLSTSRMIDDVAARYGARVVRTAVGEANVVEAMKKLKKEGKNVILGGEGNGGVIWPEVTYVRDSLGAMALTLSLMARTGKTVSELVADVPSYAIVKRKQPLAKKEDARPTVEKLARHYAAMGEGVRVDTQDGVRIDFDADRAWVHVRASNTEPILRLIGEAPTREQVDAVLDEVQRLVDAG